MRNTTYQQPISYVAWILGQTSAILGVILCLLWGFDLVILQAQHLFAQANGGVAAAVEVWYPTFGPPLVGLGIAMAGWWISHLQDLWSPPPVIIGAMLNLLALVLAVLAAAF